MRAFSCWISGAVEALLPPPAAPLPAWPLEAVEDVAEPDDEDEVLEDVLPEATLVVDAVLLVSELDADVLADVGAVVPIAPSPAAAAEVVDCICMVFGFKRKSVRRGNARAKRVSVVGKIPDECPTWINRAGP
jgi:hypothetical protein